MGRERTQGRSLAWRGGASALLLAVACTGAIDGGKSSGGSTPVVPPGNPPGNMGMSGGPPKPGDPPPAAPGAGRLRLLTRAQLENSLRDLLGDIQIAATEADTIASGFASVGATYATISPHGVEQYEAAVLAPLSQIFADPTRRATVLGCTPTGPDDQACVR